MSWALLIISNHSFVAEIFSAFQSKTAMEVRINYSFVWSMCCLKWIRFKVCLLCSINIGFFSFSVVVGVSQLCNKIKGINIKINIIQRYYSWVVYLYEDRNLFEPPPCILLTRYDSYKLPRTYPRIESLFGFIQKLWSHVMSCMGNEKGWVEFISYIPGLMLLYSP